MVLAFTLDQASAKMRNGMPSDDEEDYALPIWSGLIPLEHKRMLPVPDSFSKDIQLPAHLM
jgi:hypothetical protein